GQTATFTVKVIEKVVTGITIVPPTDLEYVEGQELNLAGGKITATYNDDSVVEDIPITSDMISGYDKTLLGEQLITVSYEGKTATFIVTVIKKVVTEITVTPPTDLEYVEGQELNLAGGKITATYNDDSVVEDIPITSDMISGYNKDLVSESQTVTVTYGGQTATFTVKVIEKVVTGITIVPPTDLEYVEGQELNLAGGKITATYNDDSVVEDIPITSNMISGYNKDLVSESQTVTVTFGGQTTTFTVKVVEKKIVSISVTPPNKVVYIEGEDLELDGATITAIYNDDSVVENIPIVQPIGYNKNYVGFQTITVIYYGLIDTFNVTVEKKVVNNIVITWPTYREYIEGQPLNLMGGKITAVYNDGEVIFNIPMTGNMVTGYNPNKVGEQTVTVTYGGKTATFTVNVRARKAVRISVSTRPKTEYLEGKDTALNLAGGKLTVYYDNNTSAIINLTDSKVTVSGFKATQIGDQTITVSYPGVSSATFTITMNKKAVESIAIAAMPTKMMYRQGVEKFDPAGGLITVFYNNDTKETVHLSKATVSGFSNLFAGDVTVTAVYQGSAVEFKVLILAENPFKDVKANEYYETPVLWAVTKEITKGTAEDTFSPNDECTRGQIVTFLWRAAGEPAPKSAKNPFKDVKKGEYYYKAVLWAVENGITNGMDATHFAPDASCTRGQVVTFLWRAAGEPAPETAKNPFKDIKKSEYYYNAVLWAVENGITNGMTDTTFAPNSTCTRGHIVTFLYRTYK
ncbi:MAG: bacterial Ig-like domain-containing protein, partial [Clostridia bacterium]|nr:bacterial Ig-like domain-containing protein [Clostridia bacterium]